MLPPKTSVFYSEETAVFTQVGYVQQPLSDNRTTLWTVECTGEKFSCPSVSCPLWYHVSGVGRLLVYSILRLTYIGIKETIPKCLNSSNVRVIGTLEYDFPAQSDHFTFKG